MYLSQMMEYLISDPQATAKYDVLNSNQLITKITNPQISTKLYKYCTMGIHLQEEKHHKNNF
jgi:hypothetical protein